MSDSKWLPEPSGYRRHRGRSCCCCLCTILLTMIILLGIAVLVCYLLLKPKAPTYDVTDVSITQFQVYQGQNSSNLAAPLLNVSMTLELLAKNPNRVKIEVENATVGLFYKGQFVGTAEIPAFEQGKNSEQTVLVPIVLENVDILGQGAQLAADISAGSVIINADTKLSGKITIWGITSPSFGAKVNCDLTLNIAAKRLSDKKCSYAVAL